MQIIRVINAKAASKISTYAKKCYPIYVDKPDQSPLDLLESLERAYNTQITVHDLKGVLSDQQGTPYFPGRNMHPGSVCRWGRRGRSGWNGRCNAHCMVEMHARFREDMLTHYLSACWKGVREYVYPVHHEDALICLLYFGAFRSPEPPLREVQSNSDLMKALQFLPELDSATLVELYAAARFLGSFILQLIADGAGASRKERILGFIRRNGHKKLLLEELASELFLSPSRTAHLVSEEFGVGFRRLVIREKVRRIKSLLASTPMTLEQIAAELELPNAYYLGRIFKEETGIAPGRWRREAQPDGHAH